jgi:hypothetical protein
VRHDTARARVLGYILLPALPHAVFAPILNDWHFAVHPVGEVCLDLRLRLPGEFYEFLGGAGSGSHRGEQH